MSALHFKACQRAQRLLRRGWVSAATAIVVSFPITRVQAQSGGPYEIRSSTVGGGGGTSSGGPFEQSGALGESEGGKVSGGPFALIGGFTPIVPAPQSPTTEPDGAQMTRFIGVVIGSGSAGEPTALRVTLSILNHPRFCCTDATGSLCSATTCDISAHCAAVPGGNQTCAHQVSAGSPDYSAMQDNVRYVNSFAFPAVGGSLDCADDGPPFNTSYRCATLGCEPEYRDWAADLATPRPNQPQVPGLIYITGDAVVPSSTLEISHIAASCGAAATANACASASAPLAVRTARWADISSPGFDPPDGQADVLDIPPILNKLKNVAPIFPEPGLWLKQRDPRPDSDAITVIDLSEVVDGGPQAKPYPASRTIDSCPHD